MGSKRSVTFGLLCALAAACTSGGGSDKASKDAGGALSDAASDGTRDAASANDGGGDARAPMAKLGTVKGRVATPEGKGVGDVPVHVGTKEVRTDNRGVFVAHDVPVGKQQVAARGSRQSGAQVGVQVDEGGTAQVDLAVLELKTVELADAAAGGVIQGDADNVKLTLPPMALKRKGDGAAVHGKVEARYALVNQNDKMTAAPGGMKAQMGSEQVDLESHGMIDLRLYQGKDELDLAKPAQLELPLGTNSLQDGADVDIWSLDERTGVWKHESKAKVDKSKGDGVAKVTVTHLSWWNADQPIANKSCLTGKLLTEKGAPIANMGIHVTGVDYLTNLVTFTGTDGSFCVDVKLGSTSRLSAFGSDATTYTAWSQDAVVAGSEPVQCGMGTCVDVGTVTGTSLFDECQGNVTHGENKVLVLSSSDAALDQAVQKVLAANGQQAVLGVPYTEFDAKVDLTGFDAVYLQANVNWSSGDMPLDGQRKLINWVNCGGGLVTSEWTTWKIGTGAFALIDAVFPVDKTSNFTSPAMETFSVVKADATLNAGLPSSFTFTTDNYAGTESNLNPRPGATIYYDSEQLDSGVIGWSFNLGRVISVSTTAGTQEVADPNFSRLMRNMVDWVQHE